MKKYTFATIAVVWHAVTWANEQTVTLVVPSMNCALCPITVKKALKKVEGVTQVDVTLEIKRAVVSFDDSRTHIEALIDSTTNAGYPSMLRGQRISE